MILGFAESPITVNLERNQFKWTNGLCSTKKGISTQLKAPVLRNSSSDPPHLPPLSRISPNLTLIRASQSLLLPLPLQSCLKSQAVAQPKASRASLESSKLTMRANDLDEHEKVNHYSTSQLTLRKAFSLEDILNVFSTACEYGQN